MELIAFGRLKPREEIPRGLHGRGEQETVGGTLAGFKESAEDITSTTSGSIEKGNVKSQGVQGKAEEGS